MTKETDHKTAEMKWRY